MEPSVDLAVVGNCAWGGLVDCRGRVVWACLPRFDSDPVFTALLDRGDGDHDGAFAVDLLDFAGCEQRYEGNTPILVTILRDASGSAVELRDFAPRFFDHGRMFRPMMLIRRIRPLRGDPRIRILVRPRFGYGAHRPLITRGSNHLRFVAPEATLRLTTSAPVSYVADATPFVLEGPIDLIFGPDESLTAPIESTAREFLERTYDHWMEWSRTLSIPFEWQDAVIRAAITLKLCSFEETGAIVAALTTSIPEAPDSGRNWDYRYCWLRDSYFVIHALNRLGATRTMEAYLAYITNLVATAQGRLQPVYGIGLESRLVERTVPGLAGYRAMGPVRVGNEAWGQPQHDVYGSVVLAATHTFFDQRLRHRGGPRLFELLEGIGEQALRLWDRPDAGIWERRTRSEVHTFSAVMCWAACDRLAKIAARLGEDARARRWRLEAQRIHGAIFERAWSAKQESFAASFASDEVDASLLLLHELDFLAAGDPRFASTVAAVERELRRGPYLFRYAGPDDFGPPRTAFNICTFWYIDALAALGRREEARELFENMLARRNRLGLLSEDLDPESGELWGNFPQTYSMVGLINSAVRLSISWEEAF
jgi:GH15 family glucan-1,4-alpha-glucosidase